MIANPNIFDLVVSASVAYFLGSLPTAYIAARIYGKDIFSIGSRQAGATNVWREVSHNAGVAVMIIDSAKGLIGVIIARLFFDLDGIWLMLPASAIIIGHWNSPFTKFRGGDGVSSLTGVALGITPVASLVSFFVIGFVTIRFNSKFSHPTIWGALSGFCVYVLLIFTPWVKVDPFVILGLTGLALCILLHSVTYHHKHIGSKNGKLEKTDTQLDSFEDKQS